MCGKITVNTKIKHIKNINYQLFINNLLIYKTKIYKWPYP